MNLLIRSVLILFLTGSSYGQKKKETYSFTMKEVLSFKNRIKELEKKDSLNIQLIQKLEDRIRMYKKELGESRTKNDFLLEKNQKVLTKSDKKSSLNYGIELINAVMCAEVDGNIPMEINETFPAGQKEIYCFSRLNNFYDSSSAIYHCWYFGQEIKAKVRIRIGNGKNQTGISKRTITAKETGQWRVDIMRADQRVLQIITFETV